jgi:hypothetical protein
MTNGWKTHVRAPALKNINLALIEWPSKYVEQVAFKMHVEDVAV